MESLLFLIAIAVGGALLLLQTGIHHRERKNYNSQIKELNERLDEIKIARRLEAERYVQEVENKNQQIEKERSNGRFKKVIATAVTGIVIKLLTNDPIIAGVIMSVIYTISGYDHNGHDS